MSESDMNGENLARPRATLDRELKKLEDRLLALGNEVEHNITKAAEVLIERDMEGSRRLIAADKEINNRRISIMNDAFTLIATQQPMAGDMRRVAAVLEISGELERINDYVKGIARNSLMISPGPLPEALDTLPLMAGKTREMLHKALEAAGRRDAVLARQIPEEDDQIDDLFNRTYRQLLAHAMDKPDAMERVNLLEWIAHNLERAADRVTNICEWVVYAVDGVYEEMDSEFEAPPSLNE